MGYNETATIGGKLRRYPIFQTERVFMIRGVCVFVFVACLAGCALLDPGPTMTSVILPVTMPEPSLAGRLPVSLRVSRPVADGATGTDRIMALMNGYEVRALDSAKWADSIPAITQRQLVDALESTRRLAGVSWEENVADQKYRLSTDIRRFFLRYDPGNAVPVVDTGMMFSLIRLDTGVVIARHFIRIEAPCRENTLDAFVAAFSEAMTKTLAQASAWVVETLEAEQSTDAGKKKYRKKK